MLRMQAGDPKVRVLLVVAVVRSPMLVGPGSRRVQIQSRKQQAVEPRQEPERPAG